MRTYIATLLALVLAGCVAQPPDAGISAVDADLAQALNGKVAQATQACVSLHEVRNQHLLPKSGAIIFEGPWPIVYLNRLGGQCTNLRWGLSLRTGTPAGRLCEGDIVQLFDAASGVSHGACALGPFEPFRS